MPVRLIGAFASRDGVPSRDRKAESYRQSFAAAVPLYWLFFNSRR
jgi:hypothetical protein